MNYLYLHDYFGQKFKTGFGCLEMLSVKDLHTFKNISC